MDGEKPSLGPTRDVPAHLFLTPTPGSSLEALGNQATPRLVVFTPDSTPRLDSLGGFRRPTVATSRATKACWWIGAPQLSGPRIGERRLTAATSRGLWTPRVASFASVSFASACSWLTVAAGKAASRSFITECIRPSNNADDEYKIKPSWLQVTLRQRIRRVHQPVLRVGRARPSFYISSYPTSIIPSLHLNSFLSNSLNTPHADYIDRLD